ncbi:MAG TPA: ATP-binding protein [Gemmatimonadales bacterium]|nr:ATP-binding protein [Gemmatimonadales bacterium]
MSDSGNAIWWVFLAGVLALAVILTGFVVALVISQRRVLKVERDHARRLLEAQEAERAWVAREVHDDALQRVAVVRAELELLLSGAAESGRPEESRKLAALKLELDDLSEVLRTVAHHLHPSMVEQAGLLAGLRSLVNEVGRSLGLRVTLVEPEAPIALRLDVALAAYRIAQEALRNVARHSGGREAEVALAVADGWVSLRVTDRGRGFPLHQNGAPRGLGLIAMQERAALAGGRFELASEPERGTVVEAAFPLAER